jgi:muconolactone delta-isomerase
MQFLTVSRRRTDEFPPEAFTPELIAGEARRVKELYAKGVVRQVWKRGDAGGAAILWEVGGASELDEYTSSLLLYRAGLLEIVIRIPLEPFPAFAS